MPHWKITEIQSLLSELLMERLHFHVDTAGIEDISEVNNRIVITARSPDHPETILQFSLPAHYFIITWKEFPDES